MINMFEIHPVKSQFGLQSADVRRWYQNCLKRFHDFDEVPRIHLQQQHNNPKDFRWVSEKLMHFRVSQAKAKR